jgi:hypothetical protein
MLRSVTVLLDEAFRTAQAKENKKRMDFVYLHCWLTEQWQAK